MASQTASMGLTLHIASLIGRIDTADELKITVVTQKSYTAYKDFWDDYGAADSGKEQFYGQRFIFALDSSTNKMTAKTISGSA